MSDPITVCEFESDEQAIRYDRWFRAKVQAIRDDPRPGIPHDEAMENNGKIIEESPTRSPPLPCSAPTVVASTEHIG